MKRVVSYAYGGTESRKKLNLQKKVVKREGRDMSETLVIKKSEKHEFDPTEILKYH